jgi:hypothetical protein
VNAPNKILNLGPLYNLVRFQVLIATWTKKAVFWNVEDSHHHPDNGGSKLL